MQFLLLSAVVAAVLGLTLFYLVTDSANKLTAGQKTETSGASLGDFFKNTVGSINTGETEKNEKNAELTPADNQLKLADSQETPAEQNKPEEENVAVVPDIPGDNKPKDSTVIPPGDGKKKKKSGSGGSDSGSGNSMLGMNLTGPGFSLANTHLK
ncbi:MAG: hypothetical protein HZA83_00995 [Thaumarchaeota archaeon]|nr:hypothetical protein [Nitrososphaerota archaeon]